MPASDILKEIALEMPEIKEAITDARELMEALKEVGEDYEDREIEINNLEKKVGQWEKMLKNRGIPVV